MRPVLRGVSLALASCLSLLGSDARADPGPAAEYGVPYAEPVPEYGVREPVPLPEPPKVLMVTGVVTRADGKPVKGVEVSLSGDVTTTDARGEYAMFFPADCVSTACEVVFTHKRYREARVPLAQTVGQHEADAVLDLR